MLIDRSKNQIAYVREQNSIFRKAQYAGFMINARYSAFLCFSWYRNIFPRRIAFMIALMNYGYSNDSRRAAAIAGLLAYGFTRRQLNDIQARG